MSQGYKETDVEVRGSTATTMTINNNNNYKKPVKQLH